MSFQKKGTPGKGEETPRREQFSYTNPPAGLAKTWNGWLAAEVYWCKAHEHKPPQWVGTKPCLNWLTDGALPCPWCPRRGAPTWIGYCHLYREVDLSPVLVLIHDSASDLCAGLTFGSYVMVGRVDGTSSAFVKPATGGKLWRSEQPHRQNQIDSALSLMGIWQIAALDEWYAAGQPAGRTDENQKPARWRLSVTPPNTKVEALAIDAERNEDGGTAGTVDDALGRIIDRTTQPSKNGRHKPPGG